MGPLRTTCHVADHTQVAFEHILVEREGPVGVVTMNRPHVLNALSPEHMGEIAGALREFEADPEVRAMVVTGGPRVFAAGADIGDMVERTAIEQLQRDQTAVWSVIAGLRKPLLAAVNGYALGGGCELALTCDLIIAGESARFGQPEINIGVLAGGGGTQRWTRTAGKYVSMEVNLSGEFIDARRAFQLGLVNRIVPSEMTVAVAKRLAAKLASKPPIALRLAKESVNAALETPLQQGLALERRNFYFLFATEDQTEGMKAFLEKRKPEWRGR